MVLWDQKHEPSFRKYLENSDLVVLLETAGFSVTRA